MTRTEDLLRSALEGAPTPPTQIADPLADLDRRVSRARRRLSITCAIAVFVVTAAVVVPLTLIGRSDAPPAAGSGRHPTSATWATAHVVAVAAGGGSVWSLEEHATRAADHADIVQRDPVTGAVEKHWIVNASYTFIAYGYGKVWIWGGGVSSFAESIAMTLDPTTGTRSATAHLGRGNAFDSVVFAAASAWAAVPERNRLLSFGFHEGASTTNVSKVRGIDSVVRVGRGLAVIGRDGSVGSIPQQIGPVNPTSRIAAGAHPWARAAGSTFWVSNRRGDLYREDLARSLRIGSSVTLPRPPLAVAADTSGGLYVALVNRSQSPTVPSLLYYSPRALDAASPRPTAIRHDGEIHRLALDPAGGVVCTNSADALIHWDPAGRALR
jgi:hypothetical protein